MRATSSGARVSFDRAVHKPVVSAEEDARRAQVVYEQNSRARAAIGRLVILSDRPDLWQRLDAVRRQIRTLHDRPETLRAEHRELMETLDGILGDVRDRFDDFQHR